MKKVFTLSALALIAVAGLGIWGCSKDNPTAAVTTDSITGIVTDSTSGTAIAGAAVVTSPATSPVSTDSSGNYTISGVTTATYTVTASKTSYNSKSITVAVTASNTATANIALAPGVPGNNAPAVPSSPSPADAATGISTAPTLSWSCSDPDAGDTLKIRCLLWHGQPSNSSGILQSERSQHCPQRAGQQHVILLENCG